MEWFTIILAIVVILYFVLPKMKQLSPSKAADLINSGARFIDVRSEGEYKTESVPGSENIPVQSIMSAAKAGKLNSEEVVVLFCQSGMRSSRAAGQLKSLGFTKVENLGTFSNAWKAHTIAKTEQSKTGS